ncbi:MAG: cytochrome P460 family protein, partial [Smithella sp.]
MKKKMIVFTFFIFGIAFAIQVLGTNIMQGKYRLKAPNGISFSEIRGYEKLQAIAVSRRTDKNELRVILGNDVIVDAYKKGIPGNGKPFPDGSAIVKIGWSERKNDDFPDAHESDVLKRIEFILKDSKRFPD